MDAQTKIAKAMKDNRWSVSTLAKAAGVTRPTVTKALHGEPLTGAVAAKISTVLFQSRERIEMIAAMTVGKEGVSDDRQ